MADFTHFEQLRVGGTAVYKMHEITVGDKVPSLTLKPATEVNKPYYNALLKRAQKTARVVRAGAVNADVLDENRAEDKELYPEHVIVGWADMIDATGTDVKFSKAACKDFIHALPDWIFDNVTLFARDPLNYVASELKVEATAKN